MNAEIMDEVLFKEYDEMHYKLENKLIKLNKSYIEKVHNGEVWKNDYQIKEIEEKYYDAK